MYRLKITLTQLEKSSIGEFIGTYTEPIDSTEVDITTTTPINLSTMVRFHWNLPDSQLKHRLHKCWATKIVDATWSDADVVQLAGDGCPIFPWITVSNPGEIRFPVFSFVNRNRVNRYNNSPTY